MGCDSVRIRGVMRKFPINTIILFYRSICNHPFLVCWVCFLVFLYKSFPFLFSLLVSASPVLACTALLLGTLLSFGQANIPREIQHSSEKEVAHQIVPLKAAVSRDATVADRDVSFTTKKLTGLRENITKKAKEQATSVETKANKIENASDTSFDHVLHLDDKPHKHPNGKQVINEHQGNKLGSALEKRRECRKVKSEIESEGEDQEVEIQYTLVGQERDEDTDMSYSRRRRSDSDEDNVGDERSSNHESENSSPATSMADIVPMMDELHPLLDGTAPQPAHMSRDYSDATSERSMGSRDDINDTNDDSENKGEEVDGDDDGEVMPGNKGGVSKSRIFWTEADHKNVMDLGTSDIERNRRLENLIARRKDWKTVGRTCNVPSITTTRRNPFDVPDDSYNATGLPPIPVSAPSVMLPRRNPFDIPFDLSEEKCDPKGESFQPEFSGFQPNEGTFIRRHESYTWGQLTFGVANQGRRDINWRPYFMPERLSSEGTSYPSFHTQLSEESDTKTSSVPDTESVSSAVDQDNEKPNEHDLSQERELIINHASDHDSYHDSQSSDIGEFLQKGTSHDGDKISMENLEIHPMHEAGNASPPVELDTWEISLKSEPIEEEYDSRSRMLSPPEASGEVSDEYRGKTKLESKSTRIEASGISKQSSHEEPELDNSQPPKEVVYDSSPPVIEKFLSFSSITPGVLVEATYSFTSEESDMQMDDIAEDISSNEVENRSQDEKANEGEHFQCEQDNFLTPRYDAEAHQNVHKKSDLLLVEEKEVHSPSHDANANVAGLHQDLDLKMASQSSNGDAPFETK